MWQLVLIAFAKPSDLPYKPGLVSALRESCQVPDRRHYSVVTTDVAGNLSVSNRVEEYHDTNRGGAQIGQTSEEFLQSLAKWPNFEGMHTALDPSYEDGAPGGIRTPDQWLRKPLLYPAELRAHGRRILAGIAPFGSFPVLPVGAQIEFLLYPGSKSPAVTRRTSERRNGLGCSFIGRFSCLRGGALR